MSKNKYKPILAIETSEKLCSVAIMLSEDDYIEFSIQKKNIHSEKLMEMISVLIDKAEISLKELAYIAVSIGPGSFTGLRIGLSVAKGLAFGHDLAIVPVSNFNALALQISNQLKPLTEFAIANKANMSELYVGKFRTKEKYFEVVEEVKLIESEEFSENLVQDSLLFGNFEPDIRKTPLVSPNAIYVAKWSYIFGKDLVTYDHDLLEPNYLKKFIVKVKK